VKSPAKEELNTDTDERETGDVVTDNSDTTRAQSAVVTTSTNGHNL